MPLGLLKFTWFMNLGKFMVFGEIVYRIHFYNLVQKNTYKRKKKTRKRKMSQRKK